MGVRVVNISLVVVTSGEKIRQLARTLSSVESIVREKLILYQGDDPKVMSQIQELLKPDDHLFTSRYKGNADIDRNYAYQNAGSEWILALDDDEFVPTETLAFIGRIIHSDAEVVWFNFRNLVDNVNIKDILGDDPHPRLWRNRNPQLIDWPAQAHTYPRINTPLQYYSSHQIIHTRTFDEIKARHESRKLAVSPEARQREEQFIEAVKRKLSP